MQRLGQQLYRPYQLALLAEAYGQAGQPEAGLPCLAEAVTRVEATEERWWAAEVSQQIPGNLSRKGGAPIIGKPRGVT